MPTPVYLNTGGGILGAIRTRIFADFDLSQLFGNRVRPGRLPQQAEYPYVVLSHISGTLDDLFTDTLTLDQVTPDHILGDRYDVWDETIQVSVYADSYEACRQCGLFLHAHLSRQTLEADCVAATLYPVSRILTIDNRQAELGTDLWHYDFRYHLNTADKLLPDQNLTGIR